MKSRTTGDIGADAEDRAVDYLRQHGLELVGRNFRCRHGEIDAIMRESNTLVFVEVRYRSDDSHGGAGASIDRHKQKRLIKAAAYFLQTRFAEREPHCRFDVIVARGPLAAPRFDWISDAFQA
jgi:putative endonuclease